jgi:Ni/Fe-hydrogenase subunit HybB-like protein
MTDEPRPTDLPATEQDYMTHHVDERDLTVDWFFGKMRFRKKVPQLLLAIVGWFFSILPIVITASAIIYRNNVHRGWWSYHEGYVMFDVTSIILGILLVIFVIGYLALLVIDRRRDGWRRDHINYDLEKLDLRLAIAEDLYAEKFGPEESRIALQNIRIEPYADFETYELRDRYRDYDVEVD